VEGDKIMYVITIELEDDVEWKDAQELLKLIEKIPEVGYAYMEKIE
jgi:hypothetical protein